MKRILVLALTLPVFLVGCGSAVEETPNGTKTDGDGSVYGTIKKVDVDGTECVVFDADGGGGALDCNWVGPVTPTPEVTDGFE